MKHRIMIEVMVLSVLFLQGPIANVMKTNQSLYSASGPTDPLPPKPFPAPPPPSPIPGPAQPK